jgi:peptidoglycan/xylan/chitin deacetylase (PgdA/CDA1 family)
MLTRRDFLKLSGIALLTASFRRLPFPAQAVPPAPIIYHGSRNLRTIALTFDDCWHPEVLQQLTAMVAPYPEFRLTFFAIGDAILIDEALAPGIWKRIYGSGHEIGYHTLHHVDPGVVSPKAPVADFDDWMSILQKVLGFRPEVHFARPPGNNLTPAFQQICSERDMVVTQFSIGYEGKTIDDGLNAAAKTLNGDIVQMHAYQDPIHGRQDVAITEKVLPLLASQGFGLVTMSKLYDQLLMENNSADGCVIGTGDSLTRTCLD